MPVTHFVRCRAARQVTVGASTTVVGLTERANETQSVTAEQVNLLREHIKEIDNMLGDTVKEQVRIRKRISKEFWLEDGHGKDQAALRRWLNVHVAYSSVFLLVICRFMQAGASHYSLFQNAKRMQQIMREIQSDYGIDCTKLSGTIAALAADNNRLAQDIEEHRHNLEEMRFFIENYAIRKRGIPTMARSRTTYDRPALN